MGFPGPNSRCWQSCVPSGGSGENPVSRGCLHALARGQSQQCPTESVTSQLWHWFFYLLLPHLKDPSDDTGPPGEFSIISFLKVSWLATLIPLPCISAYLKVPGLRCGHVWRGCYYPAYKCSVEEQIHCVGCLTYKWQWPSRHHKHDPRNTMLGISVWATARLLKL